VTFLGLANDATFAADDRLFEIQYTAYAVTLTDLQAVSLPSSIPVGESGLAFNQTITPTVEPIRLRSPSHIKNPDGLTISGSGSGTVNVAGVPLRPGPCPLP